jgi:hypothetical protein
MRNPLITKEDIIKSLDTYVYKFLQ